MFGKVIVNITTVLLVLNNCYGYFKDRKNKHYRYYFLILCLFLVFDSLFSYLTNLVPFFQIAKFAFIIWLSLPMFNGPVFIYNFYMKKIFVRFEADIDLQLEMARKKFMDTFVERLNQAYGKCYQYNERLLGYNGKSNERASLGEPGPQEIGGELMDNARNEALESAKDVVDNTSYVQKENLDKLNASSDVEKEMNDLGRFVGRNEGSYNREEKMENDSKYAGN
ncbi:HVA22/DP1t-related protein [Trachipleistophora hominis]|uniref:Protein YOP1 n=1 Tax=Trachipleistophora hominis TaxID=72359 RepID=L7JSL6_TRAHO|nr:HVA22/DP1t-related protein [Trachipleistophora hominis]